MVSEAGLEKRKEPELRGYTAYRADHNKCTRGSVMYVRDRYVYSVYISVCLFVCGIRNWFRDYDL